MMPRVAKVAPPSQYRLHVEFDDGVAGTIDLSPELDGEVFQPLGDEAVFRQVTVDEFGAVCWPNAADLAPDAMHSELTGKPPPQSTTAGEGRTPRRRETATKPLSLANFRRDNGVQVPAVRRGSSSNFDRASRRSAPSNSARSEMVDHI
jgi:hypothetical protein